MWKSTIPLPRLRGLPCASTQRTVFGCAESAGIERLSRAHELARVAAGVRGMAQHSAEMAASVGGAVTELGRDLLPAQAGDVLEMDEVVSFVGEKFFPRWLWTAQCRRTRQIVAYAIGDHSEETGGER